VSGREVCTQLDAAEFYHFAILQNAIDLHGFEHVFLPEKEVAPAAVFQYGSIAFCREHLRSRCFLDRRHRRDVIEVSLICQQKLDVRHLESK
jgi:hypothetical protein